MAGSEPTMSARLRTEVCGSVPFGGLGRGVAPTLSELSPAMKTANVATLYSPSTPPVLTALSPTSAGRLRGLLGSRGL